MQQKKFNGYDYAFSIIMAAYNVAPYLREAMDSLTRQTFGFQNVQVILVDDGSTDETPALCDQYQKQYPDNVLALHKKNGGVSSARNLGLQHARGRYINFMDPDDKLSTGALQAVYAFFQAHDGETDIAAIPMHYFDAETKPHVQNFKFDRGTRVVDLMTEWAIPHASASSSFITAEMASRFTFDTRLTYGEDGCYVNKIMLHKATIGMVSNAAYYYRKRRQGSSAMQNSRTRKTWYLDTAWYFMEELLRYARELRGEVPLFTQYNVMYDMQWRLPQEQVPAGVLTQAEITEYRETVDRILRQLDDRVIAAQRFLADPYKYYAIRRNHAEEPAIMYQDASPMLCYSNYVVTTPESISLVYDSITVLQNQAVLTGYLSVPVHSFRSFGLCLKCGSQTYSCTLTPGDADKHFLGDPVSIRYRFSCHVPLSPAQACTVVPLVIFGRHTLHTSNVSYQLGAPLSAAFKSSYALMGGYCVSQSSGVLTFTRRKVISGLKKETAMLTELLRKGMRKAAVLRLSGKIARRLSRMDKWLVYGGANPADPALRRLIDDLHAENPAVRLYVMFDAGVKAPGSLGPASVVRESAQSMAFKQRLLGFSRICFQQKDWDVFNPYWHPNSPYRALLAGTELTLLTGEWQIQSTQPCDMARTPLKKNIRRACGLIVRVLDKFVGSFARRVFSFLVRRLPQNRILFESMPPYSDNTWAVYQYIRDNGLLKDYKLIWLLQEGDTPRADIPSIVKRNTRTGGIRYFYNALRTKAFVYCNQRQFKLRADQLTINLGHGSCLKSVHGHYNMPGDLDYMLIQAPAFEDATRYEHSVAPGTIIAALGYPRNDDFFGDMPLDRNTLFPTPFKKLLIWYPTYRQHKNGQKIASSITLPLIHDAGSAQRINACAAENGVLVVLKPHFAQDTSYINKTDLSNLVFIDDSFFTRHGIRPYQFLHMSDGLITDFSSVYYDYLLQDKPIALVWEDIEEYRQTSGFAVDTDVYCAGGEKVYTEEELCGFIRRIARDEDVLKTERAQVSALTNAYPDGLNAQRTALWVDEVVRAYPRKIKNQQPEKENPQ